MRPLFVLLILVTIVATLVTGVALTVSAILLVSAIERPESFFEAALSQVAPGTDDVGPDVDLHCYKSIERGAYRATGRPPK